VFLTIAALTLARCARQVAGYHRGAVPCRDGESEIVLAGLDLGFEHVVMARIYLTRFRQDYAAMNETYRNYFAQDRLPARTCVGVTSLAYDALIEIDLVARRPA